MLAVAAQASKRPVALWEVSFDPLRSGRDEPWARPVCAGIGSVLTVGVRVPASPITDWRSGGTNVLPGQGAGSEWPWR